MAAHEDGDRVLKVLRLSRAIPRTVEEDQARQVELRRQDDLLAQAATLVFPRPSMAAERDGLLAQLREVLDRHLDRLEEEARQGKFSEAELALHEIEGAASRLLSSLNRAPVAALDWLQIVPGGSEQLYRLIEWEGPSGRDQPLGTDREVFETAPPDARRSPSGLMRRLAALEKLARLTAKHVKAKGKDPEVSGAKSVREAMTGMTPDLDLFEDCTRILGPLPKGLARLREVAALLSEAATRTRPTGGWGRDHESRARRWWRAVRIHMAQPLARVPEEAREILEAGLASIKLPNRRGKKKPVTSTGKRPPQTKART